MLDAALGLGGAAVELLKAEFCPVLAASAEEGFSRLSSGEFAVLVVIQDRPGLSGALLLADVRRKWPLVQGIILAGYPAAQQLADALTEGEGLALPWVDQELLAAVRQAVRTYRVKCGQLAARERAEKALRLRERWYRLILEHAADGVLITNSNGDYIDANLAICRLLGYTREEIMQLNVRDLVLAEADADSLQLDDVLAGNVLRVSRRLQAKDGRLVPVESRVCLLPDGRLQALVRELAS